MEPTLRAGRVVLATRFFWRLKPGQLVVIKHRGLEKIKRLERVRDQQIFVLGDNSRASLDSRSFGWLPIDSVRARVIWPRV